MNVARFVCTENMAQTILPDHSGHPQTVLNYEAVNYFSGEEYEASVIVIRSRTTERSTARSFVGDILCTCAEIGEWVYAGSGVSGRDAGPKTSSESPAPCNSDSDKDKAKKEKEAVHLPPLNCRGNSYPMLLFPFRFESLSTSDEYF